MIECLIDYARKLARNKHSSLLLKCVNYGQKKFYNIGPWSNVVGKAKSAGTVARGKHSSLSRTFVTYGRKKFHDIGLMSK
jgi:hypothetical protein